MNTLSNFAVAKAAYLAETVPKLTDKSIPLDERWEMYKKLVEEGCLPEDGYSDGFITTLTYVDGGEPTLYDDFHMDRNESKTFPRMYEIILEDEIDADEGGKYTPESITEWREEVLASGYGSFENDW